MRALVWSTAVAAVLLTAGCSGGESETGAVSASPSAAAVADKVAPLPQGKRFTVDDTAFTIHSFNSNPETKSTNFRMACYPLWSQTEPKKGKYDWTLWDQDLFKQRAYGATVLLHAFCGTPKWAAAGKVKDPSQEVFGPMTTAAPKMGDFQDYVTTVVKRYKDDIDAWEVWNEATSPQFFQGTPQQMAEMTKIVKQVVAKEDPDAVVTSASVQTHRDDYFEGFAVPYLKALAKMNWPVDVYNGHFYPPGKGGPAERRDRIESFRKTLAKLKAPNKPLWDTEVNYYTELTGGEPDGRITGDQAAAWAVRTYLDGWRLDVPRNYWYFGTPTYNDFPGIQTRPGDPATVALATFHGWVDGTTFNGCEQKSELVTCSFLRDGSEEFIAWAEDPKGDDSKNVKASVPVKGSVTLCTLPDNSCKKTAVVVVDQTPALITPEP